MDAQTLPQSEGLPLRERLRETAAVQLVARHPQATAVAVIAAFVIWLLITDGLQAVAQNSLNGLAYGSAYALGAVGLTLVYGILKLVNFAHGEFLTFGAYIAFAFSVTVGLPLAVAALIAVGATALLGVFLERVMWAPMRARGAGILQLLLMSIGLAFLIRYGIQFFAGSSPVLYDIDRSQVVAFLGLRIGNVELIAIGIGFVVLVGIGLLLKLSLLGKRMRALSDDLDLAETAGIDTSRVILYTWILAGASAGLAGVLYGAIADVRPELGFSLLLAIFAAVILGGIGDAFGALLGGVVLGLVTELSVLFLPSEYKLVVGFVVLILVLVLRPQGILGQARTV